MRGTFMYPKHIELMLHSPQDLLYIYQTKHNMNYIGKNHFKFYQHAVKLESNKEKKFAKMLTLNRRVLHQVELYAKLSLFKFIFPFKCVN